MKRLDMAEMRAFAAVGVASAFAVATVDLLSDAPLLAARFHGVSFFLETFAISLGVLLIAYFCSIPIWIAASFVVRVPPLAGPMASAGALFWLRGFLQAEVHRPLSDSLSLIALVVLGFGVGWFFGRLMEKSEEWKRFAARTPIAVIVCSLAVLSFFWWTQFGGRETAKASSVMVAAAWVLLVVGILFAVYGRVRLATPQRALVGLAALFLGSLSLSLFSAEFKIADDNLIGGTRPPIRAVIFIVVDTLRTEALRPYNPEASAAGGFEEFANDSFVFENAISPSAWTYPSMLSLMTGYRTYIKGSYLQGLLQMSYEDSNTAPTMARYLADAGYHTRGILGNHLIYRPRQVTDGLADAETYSLAPTGFSVGAKFGRRISLDRYLAGGGTETLTDQAIEFLGEQAEADPFFLWLHYFDPHDEYAPPLSYVPEGLDDGVWHHGDSDGATDAELAPAKQLYDGEARFVGDSLSRLFSELKRLNLYEDSLIVLTSDHGEEFMEHGGMYHGHTLYQELLHVPLMIRLPGQQQAHRVKSFVPTRALLPTILEICGIDVPEEPEWAASLFNLMQTVSDGADEEGVYRQPIVSGGALDGQHETSVVVDGFKYIVHRDGPDADLLFDLKADPAEVNSITDRDPAIMTSVQDVITSYQKWASDMRGQSSLNSDASKDTTFTDRLKDLGYIQ